MKKKIYVSILTANFLKLDRDLKALQKAGIERLHFDVIDNHFAPNLTLGNQLLRLIKRKYPKIIVNTHLMVTPNINNTIEMIINNFKESDSICIHIESLTIPQYFTFINLCKEKEVKKGLAINPKSDLDYLLPFLKDLDIIILMSVQPGFGGQTFIPAIYQRLKQLQKIIKEKNLKIEIIIDGGINPKIIEKCSNEFAINSFVVGSYLWRTKNNLFEETKKFLENL